MSASAAALKCQALRDEWQTLRRENRAGVAALSSVVPAVRAVVYDAQEDVRRRAEVARLRGLKRAVLVVEDDSTMREILSHALSDALGAPVYAASTIDEAVALWNDHKPSVVVVDLFLGGQSHGDKFISALPHSVRAVLFSGIADKLTLESVAATCNAIPCRKGGEGEKNDVVGIVRGIIDLVHPPCWCRANTDTFLDVSTAFAALLGYTPGDMIGQRWSAFVHPDDLAAEMAEREQRRGKGVEGFCQRMLARDGSIVPIAWDVTPLTDGVLYATGRRV